MATTASGSADQGFVLPRGPGHHAERGHREGLHGGRPGQPRQHGGADAALEQPDHEPDTDGGEGAAAAPERAAEQPHQLGVAGDHLQPRAEHDDGDGRLGRGQGQVEDQLVRLAVLAAEHAEADQGAGGAGQQECQGPERHQREEERRLAEEDERASRRSCMLTTSAWVATKSASRTGAGTGWPAGGP